MKDKYPLIMRVFIVFPVIIIMGVIWAFIGLFSTYDLGDVLQKTGKNLQKQKPNNYEHN